MSYESILFYSYLGLVLAAGTGAVLFFLLRGLNRRDEVWRSLNLKLFRITMPRAKVPETSPTLEQLREQIGAMEKIYANLHGVRESFFKRLLYGSPSFALELTVPHIGEEITFYIAIPRSVSLSIEKIIEGVFPEARVEPIVDYNIFNPEGVSAGSAITLARSFMMPVKTYRQLENDPMKELANVFSKLQHVGEGAALQIVARPAKREIGQRIMSHARMAFLGKTPIVPEGVFKEGLRMLTTATKNESKKPEEKVVEQHRLSPKEEEQIRMMESKGSKTLFEANIRVIASAPTRARAEEIVKSIEGAFLQYRDPTLNEFQTQPLGGRQLEKAIYQFSFRIFDPHNSAVLSSEELTSLYHFPNVPLETPKLKVVKAREASPPVNLPNEGILIGYNVFRGETREARLTENDRRRHVYVIGQTGTGKTALMTEMIRQDIFAGKGVCFIDPHGDSVEEILGFIPPGRIQDVIYFNPGETAKPLGLNMLEYDQRYPEQKTFVVNELFSIFQKLYGAVPEALGPMFEQYFRNSTLLVLDDPASGNTLLEVERVFVDKAFRDLKLSRSNNVVIKTFWREIAEKAGGEAALANMVPYITSKFDTFLANEIMRPIIAQEKSAFDFREVMDKGKILLINLSKGRLGELNSSLIGLIMVGKLLMGALSRADTAESERRDFYLYIDEFQNVTTRSIATILSEARKYHLDLNIAHQFLGQLEDEIKKAVFGNVGSIIAFRIGSDDAEFLSTQFKPVFEAQDLLNIDNYNAYVKLLINGQTSQPFNVHTYPPGPKDVSQVQQIKDYSSMIYGRPREEVEAEIQARYKNKVEDET